jgi:hypothetical protein
MIALILVCVMLSQRMSLNLKLSAVPKSQAWG